jgi:acyl dehydratase
MAERIRVGDKAVVQRVFSAADVAAFAHLSGDDNPIHRDRAAAIQAGFEREVVHGVLVTSLISQLLGTRLPGPGTILLGQQLTYRRPVLVDQEVRASVEVLSVREDKPVIVLRTWVETEELALDGEATVLFRPLASDETGASSAVSR